MNSGKCAAADIVRQESEEFWPDLRRQLRGHKFAPLPAGRAIQGLKSIRYPGTERRIRDGKSR